jgi:hypothetical protein
MDERSRITEQLRRYRALLGATPDSGVRAALEEMIRRLETRLRQEEGGEPQAPPPFGKHPNR